MTDSWFHAVYGEEVYQFRRRVSVVIDVPYQQMNASDRELLAKILAAVGHSEQTVHLVCEPALNLSAWSSKPDAVIAFTPPPAGVALHTVMEAAGTTLLFAGPLSSLVDDAASKQKLWGALKPMFLQEAR